MRRRLVCILGVCTLGMLIIVAVLLYGGLGLYIEFECIGNNDQGLTEYRHRKTGIVFVKIPGGKFLMGSPESEEGRDEDEVLHYVTVSEFLIAKYEMTREVWSNVMGDFPRRVHRDAVPIERISWLDVVEFGRRTGLRMPSEAQWEYACRAGKLGPYGGTGVLSEMGWYFENFDHSRVTESMPVGQKEPNDFGLYDMHGNVGEYCEDVYEQEFYLSDAAGERDPVCKGQSEEVVVRGGGIFADAPDCRCASRWHLPKFTRVVVAVGFRPAYSP